MPINRSVALQLASGALPSYTGVAHLATAGLLDAHGLKPEDTEDAEFTALGYAGVSALGSGDLLRLVLAAEVPPEQVRESPADPFGRGEVSGLRWLQVRALFADEERSAAALAAARDRVEGQALEQVLDSTEIESLLDSCDLLWFAPEELAYLPQPGAD